MRFVFLTPGTGSFYCGSCVRDHALTEALRADQHDVLHVPLYLPHMVDGIDDSQGNPIFFGGINVYLQERVPVFRRTPEWLDRWFDSRWLLKKVAGRSGSTSPHELGALTHSMLLGIRGHQAKELQKLAAWLAEPAQRPDVIALSNILLAGMAGALREATGARILCSLQGEESFLQDLPEEWREKCWAALREDLKDIDEFIAPSQWFADQMRGHLGKELQPLHVVPNGVKQAAVLERERSAEPVVIGYLARLCELKGLPRLVEAFLALCDQPGLPAVELHLAGTVTGRDTDLVEQLKQKIAGAGRTNQVQWRINLSADEKAGFLANLDLLSVPALYGEAFGLYVVEAWAAGVPTVQPRHAAFIELTEQTGAGWLFDPEVADGYQAVLTSAIQNEDERKQRGQRGREAVANDFGLHRMVTRFLELAAG